ncbi:MAG: SurA N-terminal domain-containing protein, partial [Pseudomonadota bacterium]
MLEKIRKIAHHFLFKVFFIILAIMFAVSLGDINKGGSKEIIAHVGKEQISLNDFLKARQAMVREYTQQLNLDPATLESLSGTINKTVVNQLVTQLLIKQELKNLGIVIPDKVIIEHIHKNQMFQKNGVFDANLFKDLLSQNGITEKDLLSYLSTDIASKFLMTALNANLAVSNRLTDNYYNYLDEKRSVFLVNVDTSKLKLSNFPEKELIDYYKSNQSLFLSPEYRSFSYLLLDSKNHKFEIPIVDLEKEYNENKEEYAAPEARDF